MFAKYVEPGDFYVGHVVVAVGYGYWVKDGETFCGDETEFAVARGKSACEILLGKKSVAVDVGYELFGGAVLVEQVFSYPGIGQTAVAAGLQSDVPLFLGIVLFSAVFVFVGNLLADISYYLIDPRI